MRLVKGARAVAVTAGLIVGGAGLGAYFAVMLLGMLEYFIDPLGNLPQPRNGEMLASVVGFVVGGFLGPLVVWTDLQDVPIWRTFAHTGGGAVIGGAIAFSWSNWNPLLALGGATLGVVAAALELRLRLRTRSEPLL